ncbi:MAG: hypothetical protein U0K54_01200 [Acutalibacteraceae bacterium]|nr:hypothetical protein [Acutalibacteraceae bacterium]
MLKKTFAAALSLCLIIGLCGCGELQQNTPSSSEEDPSSQITSSAEKDDKEDEKDNNNKKDPLMTKDYTNPSIYTLDTLVSMGLESPRKSDKAIDKAADKMLKTIEARPDTLKPKAGGKYIYVATNGTYGKGNKPTVYGSKKNYADVKWSEEGENIYRVLTGTASDIGLIVFDRGSCMILIMIADKKGNFPKFMGNTYAQTENKSVLEKQGQPFNFKSGGDKVVTDVIGDKTGKIIKY